MSKETPFYRIVIVLVLASILAGCGSMKKKEENDKIDYKTSRKVPTLEVPPDLTSSGIHDPSEITTTTTSTFSDYSRTSGQGETSAVVSSSTVLPPQKNLFVERDGDRQWLVVEGQPDQIWPVLEQFWTSSGFVLKLDEPEIGIMETDWAENRADIPKDPLRKVIGKAFDFIYSSATRDKYRVRLERGVEEGYTELFLTHRGMEEVVQGPADEETGTIWRPRPSDPELEAEMLKRIMVRLGVQQQRADALLATASTRPPQARLVEARGGVTTLILTESFAQAWRRTGIALDRTGFVVEDRNRSQGRYFVRYDDPEKSTKKKGWLSKLNPFKGSPGEEKKYQIELTSSETETRIIVLDEVGEHDDSVTAKRILSLLYDQLK